jgi:hypothetical protein
MIVWVNVWGKVLGERLGIVTVALALCLGGCIDDFDHPQGYGGDGSNGGSSGVSGYDCAALCRESQSCDGSDPRDCKSECDQVENLVNQSGCDDSFNNVLRCLSRLSDPCSQQDVCADDINDFSTCISLFCQVHPEDCSTF